MQSKFFFSQIWVESKTKMDFHSAKSMRLHKRFFEVKSLHSLILDIVNSFKLAMPKSELGHRQLHAVGDARV